MEEGNKNTTSAQRPVLATIFSLLIFLFAILFLLFAIQRFGSVPLKAFVEKRTGEQPAWQAPDTAAIRLEKNAALIRYGRELIVNTPAYFGPHGKISASTNGMSCQSCHLEAGTKLFGNNYSAVASTYPKFRPRSGTVETIFNRVNGCFERSLNGASQDTNGREMRAIEAYIKWLGKNVPRGKRPNGSGITKLTFMDRATDPEKGKAVYLAQCKSCHAEDGEGKLDADGSAYQYPPLWGKRSYNTGAGLFRLSRFAGYVKSNMPQGVTYLEPRLSNEEAWDVAAYVNSQPRPEKDQSKDWPEINSKPVDYPFGPYSDGFSEAQHKYGPFEPIAMMKNKTKTAAH